MTLRERYLLYSRLAVLLKAGLPLDRALETLALKAPGRNSGQAIARLARSAIEGKSLAEAMRSIHDEFPGLDVELISAGERTNSLTEALNQLAAHLEGAYRQILKERPLKTYLMILLVLAVLFLAAMIAFQISHQGEPIFLYLFFRGRRPLVVVPGLVISLGLISLLLCSILLVYGQAILDWIALRQPWLGRRALLADWTGFCRSMALALRAGLPMHQSVALAAAGVNNWALRSSLIKLEGPLAEGTALSKVLEGLRGVPPALADLARSGEDKGDLAGMLERLAAEWEPRSDYRIEILPLIIISIFISLIGIHFINRYLLLFTMGGP